MTTLKDIEGLVGESCLCTDGLCSGCVALLSAIRAVVMERDRYEKALQLVSSMGSATDPWPPEVEMRKVARTALAGQGDGVKERLADNQQYTVVVPVNCTAAMRTAMSGAYDRNVQFVDRWDRVYNAALNAALSEPQS